MFECLYFTSFVFLDSFSILIFLVSKYFSLSTFKFCVCVCVCLSNCYAYLWMSGCLESPLDVIVIYLFVKILLLPVISVCCYTYVHITCSHMLASIYSVQTFTSLLYYALWILLFESWVCLEWRGRSCNIAFTHQLWENAY